MYLNRMVPMALGLLFVGLIVVFVAHLFGAVAASIPTSTDGHCEVAVEYTCPIDGK
jgi:hypothetical protein